MITETLIMLCAIEIAKEMFGEKDKVLAKILMSKDTVKQRITSMSEDIVSQCIDRLFDSNFAVQLDESTDILKVSHLLVQYV